MGYSYGRRLLCMSALALLPTAVCAKEWTVHGDARDLRTVLRRAAPGDTVRVMGGVYRGNFVVSKPLTLLGEGNPILDGMRQKSVITLNAPRCVLRGFVVRNSGVILNDQDSAVRVAAPDCIVEDNQIEDALFGVHLDNAHRTIVRCNFIRSHDLPVARRGDQICIWYSHHARIEQNTVVGGATWCSGTRRGLPCAAIMCAARATASISCIAATALWKTTCSTKTRWAST